MTTIAIPDTYAASLSGILADNIRCYEALQRLRTSPRANANSINSTGRSWPRLSANSPKGPPNNDLQRTPCDPRGSRVVAGHHRRAAGGQCADLQVLRVGRNLFRCPPAAHPPGGRAGNALSAMSRRDRKRRSALQTSSTMRYTVQPFGQDCLGNCTGWMAVDRTKHPQTGNPCVQTLCRQYLRARTAQGSFPRTPR
jgi:hypothetical protein